MVDSQSKNQPTLGDSGVTDPPEEVLAIRAANALSFVEEESIVFCLLVEP